jgi:hypothetical protein
MKINKPFYHISFTSSYNKNVSEKLRRETKMFSAIFFEYRSVYELMWKTCVKRVGTRTLHDR